MWTPQSWRFFEANGEDLSALADDAKVSDAELGREFRHLLRRHDTDCQHAHRAPVLTGEGARHE